MLRGVLVVVALLGAVPVARAQDGAPPPAPAPAPAPAPRGDGSGHPDRLEYGARVFVRDTLQGLDLSGTTQWSENRSIDSGRAFVDFRPNRKLRMVLEVELAGGAELKDTFILYRPAAGFGIRAGRFKRPVSFISLASAWSLPRIDRGLLSELAIDGRRLSFVGGRGDGVALEARLPGPLAPRLTVALFENPLNDDVVLDASESLGHDAFARVELEPVDDLDVAVAGGLVGALRDQAEVASYRHFAFGTIELAYHPSAVRVWLEAMAGKNASAPDSGGDLAGSFVAARGLVAPRFERVLGVRTLEPFAAFAFYQPSTRAERDRVTEATVGIALALSRHLRLQLEGGRRFADDLAPITDSTLIRVQLGAAFEAETTLH